MRPMAFIQFQDVKKIYHSAVDVIALHDLSFTIDQGQFVVILGQSGAGKTTLLNLLGGMDHQSGGSIQIGDLKLEQLSKKELVNFRREDIGFVFQFYNLVTNLTAIENVELACQLCKDAFDPETILEKVGLKDRMHNFPSQLSGGEQQRVAIARALLNHPKLIFADEPTGNLDPETAASIVKLLHDATLEGTGVVMTTHNIAMLNKFPGIVYRCKDGALTDVTQEYHNLDLSEDGEEAGQD